MYVAAKYLLVLNRFTFTADVTVYVTTMRMDVASRTGSKQRSYWQETCPNGRKFGQLGRSSFCCKL